MEKNFTQEATIVEPITHRLDMCVSSIQDDLEKNIKEVEKMNKKMNKNNWVHRKLSNKKNYSRWKSH